MIGGMGKHGDITDEFDDDELRRSIETASTKGSWKSDAGFEDPKLKEIAQKLATAPVENYAERRLRELQERAARKEQSLAKPAEPTRFAEEPMFRDDPDEWRERVVPTTPPSATTSNAHANATRTTPASEQPTPTVVAKGNLPQTPARALVLRSWLRPLGAAALTFGLGAAAHGAVTDWAEAAIWRAAAATLVTGVAWRQLELGRLSTATSSAAVFFFAFGTSSAIGNPSHQFGMFLGVMVATVGGFLAGFAAEARRSAGYRPATLPTNDKPLKPC